MADKVEVYLFREFAIKTWLEDVLCVDDLSAFVEEEEGGEGSDLRAVLQVRFFYFIPTRRKKTFHFSLFLSFLLISTPILSIPPLFPEWGDTLQPYAQSAHEIHSAS